MSGVSQTPRHQLRVNKSLGSSYRRFCLQLKSTLYQKWQVSMLSRESIPGKTFLNIVYFVECPPPESAQETT